MYANSKAVQRLRRRKGRRKNTLCRTRTNRLLRRSRVFTRIAKACHQIKNEAHRSTQRHATPQVISKAAIRNMVTAAWRLNKKWQPPKEEKKATRKSRIGIRPFKVRHVSCLVVCIALLRRYTLSSFFFFLFVGFVLSGHRGHKNFGIEWPNANPTAE